MSVSSPQETWLPRGDSPQVSVFSPPSGSHDITYLHASGATALKPLPDGLAAPPCLPRLPFRRACATPGTSPSLFCRSLSFAAATNQRQSNSGKLSSTHGSASVKRLSRLSVLKAERRTSAGFLLLFGFRYDRPGTREPPNSGRAGLRRRGARYPTSVWWAARPPTARKSRLPLAPIAPADASRRAPAWRDRAGTLQVCGPLVLGSTPFLLSRISSAVPSADVEACGGYAKNPLIREASENWYIQYI